jgi:hypothetical protein
MQTSILDGIVFQSRRPPISYARRAVERRVARRLAPDGLMLRKCNPRSRWYCNLGDYYVCRADDRLLVDSHLDLDNLAREVGVLTADQAVIDG